MVDRALDAYEKAKFWQETRHALIRHPGALEEDAVWERSLRDGLEGD